MSKDDLEKLVELCNDCMSGVTNAIKELTAVNPLVLFEKDKLNTDEGIMSDEVYEFPFVDLVGRHEEHFSGVVMSVQGEDIKVFLTADEYGQVWDASLSDVSYPAQVDLLQHLIERM